MKRALIAAIGAVIATSVTSAEDLGPIKTYELSDSEISIVEQGVRDTLKDPDSARFDNIQATVSEKGGMTICGFVNAKNGFGGYTGKSPFMGMILKLPTSSKFISLSLGASDEAEFVTRRVCEKNGIKLP